MEILLIFAVGIAGAFLYFKWKHDNREKSTFRGVSMATSQSAKRCKYYDCTKTIPSHYVWCPDHFQAAQKGEINECPKCKQGKGSGYPTCPNCRPTNGAKKPYRRYNPEYSPDWEAGDKNATEFYVYILKLDDGEFYAGQTREIRERLMEHRDGTVQGTTGKNPKLVWFSTISTRGEATALEQKLKMLCDKNQREVRRWIRRFQDLVEELEFN